MHSNHNLGNFCLQVFIHEVRCISRPVKSTLGQSCVHFESSSSWMKSLFSFFHFDRFKIKFCLINKILFTFFAILIKPLKNKDKTFWTLRINQKLLISALELILRYQVYLLISLSFFSHSAAILIQLSQQLLIIEIVQFVC
jgi:hypothetical protein